MFTLSDFQCILNHSETSVGTENGAALRREKTEWILCQWKN